MYIQQMKQISATNKVSHQIEIYVQDQFETAVDDWMFKGVDTYLEAGEEFAKGQVEIDGQRKEVTLFGEGNFYIMN